MTDTTTPAEDPSQVENIKAQAQQLVQNVKTELAARLDQLLDEIGALI